MCLVWDNWDRFQSTTPMVPAEWEVDIQRLEPDKQHLARGSWLQPATRDGVFGQAPSPWQSQTGLI